jgi:hypothetical protein
MHKQVFETNCRLLIGLQLKQAVEVPAEHERHEKWHTEQIAT